MGPVPAEIGQIAINVRQRDGADERYVNVPGSPSGHSHGLTAKHMTNYRDEAPQVLCDFLSYHETIKAHSQKTVDEYFLDLRNFFQRRSRCLLQWSRPAG